MKQWLPTSKKEVQASGWDELDVILFTGDAYVDHPSFGAAVIGRVLEAQGYRVAIIPQPNWQDDLRDFKKLGVPRLFFGITSGAMDSMVNHYTANKRLRSDDAYTAGDMAGFRPDHAVTVYSRIVKSLFPDVPVVIGGIEASLRRLTHYDYWENTLKPSILIDSCADLLVYGMGEHAIRLIARALSDGKTINELENIPQTAFLRPSIVASNHNGMKDLRLHSYQDCVTSKQKFAENFCNIERESNQLNACRLIEEADEKYVIVNPPVYHLDEKDADEPYDLPYTRLPHPRYQGKMIPAFEMIKFSVNIHRGCFGRCSFCAISVHQGKFIISRSERSILDEVKTVTEMPDFKGNLSDLGGPSANMYGMRGINFSLCGGCSRFSCVFPKLCRNLNSSHARLLSLYAKVRNIEGIKNVFIGSGIRYDLFLDANGFRSDEHARYFRELIMHHVSGRLKVAPEHCAPHVLKVMRKPDFSFFIRLQMEFNRINGKEQRYQLVPYFMSNHPGCTFTDMHQLSATVKSMRIKCVEQIQDFMPTPMTLSSVMYYCGFDPYSGRKIYVSQDVGERRRQKNLIVC